MKLDFLSRLPVWLIEQIRPMEPSEAGKGKYGHVTKGIYHQNSFGNDSKVTHLWGS